MSSTRAAAEPRALDGRRGDVIGRAGPEQRTDRLMIEAEPLARVGEDL